MPMTRGVATKFTTCSFYDTVTRWRFSVHSPLDQISTRLALGKKKKNTCKSTVNYTKETPNLHIINNAKVRKYVAHQIWKKRMSFYHPMVNTVAVNFIAKWMEDSNIVATIGSLQSDKNIISQFKHVNLPLCARKNNPLYHTDVELEGPPWIFMATRFYTHVLFIRIITKKINHKKLGWFWSSG